MKWVVRNLILLFVGFLFLSPALPLVAQPSGWIRFGSEPVIDVGAPGSWDFWRVNNHDVNFEDGTFKMWFTGASQPNRASIGYATSQEGVFWEKDSLPVLTPDSSGWDDRYVGLPVVIVEDGIHKMWYGGDNGVVGGIGYATSTDGGVSWAKYDGNPVMQVGIAGSWDDLVIAPCTVLREDGIYKMWYVGTQDLPLFEIGYATSEDGIVWTKHPDPVLPKGNPGSWDDFFVHTPEVIKQDNLYHMWYLGRTQATRGRIGYATSSDGLTWTRFSEPVFLPSNSGDWDGNVVAHPRVLEVGEAHYMWYAGNDGSNVRIGMAICVEDCIVGISGLDAITADNFSLSQNYPNPFNPSTSIPYELSTASTVILKIYNTLGQEVKTLVNEQQSPGSKAVIWDGRDQFGRAVSSGIYIYKLQTYKAVRSRKMILIR